MNAAPEEPPASLGVQNERTTLAWRRTNLSALGAAALAARASGRPDVALVVIATALVVTALVGREADRRSRCRATALVAMEPGRAWPMVATVGGVAAATALTVVLAVVGLVVVAVG